jgi:hypothetical protein
MARKIEYIYGKKFVASSGEHKGKKVHYQYYMGQKKTKKMVLATVSHRYKK